MNSNIIKKRKACLISIFVIWIIVILALSRSLTTDAFVFSLAPFTGAAIIIHKKNISFSKVNYIYFLLTMLFFVQLSCSELFTKMTFGNNISIKIIFSIVFSACLILASYVCINAFIEYALLPRKHFDNETLNKIPYTGLYVISTPLILMTILFVIGTFPLYSYPDIVGVLNQIRNGEWHEWHTIGFYTLTKIFTLNAKYPYILSIVQGIAWIYIANYAIYIIHKVIRSKQVCIIYIIAATAIFTPSLYSANIVKDPIFCMSMFLLMLSLIDCLYENQPTRMSMILVIISSIGVSIFRHAGWIAALIAVMIFTIIMFKSKKQNTQKGRIRTIIILSWLIVFGIVFINNIFPRIVDAEPNAKYVKYTIPLYMAAAMQHKLGDDMPKEDKDTLEILMPIERWEEGYVNNRYWADAVSRGWGVIGNDITKINDNPELGISIVKLNAKWFVQHPIKYMSSIFDISNILWEIGRPADGYERAPLSGGAVDFDAGDSSIVVNTSHEISRALANWSFQTPVIRSIYWRGGIWLFIMCISSLILILKKQYKYLVSITAPFITLLLLFISVPEQDPRYILFMIECNLFLLIFSTFIENKSQI